MKSGNKNSNTKNKFRGLIVQGSILALAGILCRIMGLARRIPLTNIIGDTGNGYYAAAYEVYSIVLILSSYSLPSAVSKLVAARQTRGQYRKMQNIFKNALILSMFFGGLCSILVFVFADKLAGGLMGEPMSALALRILAPTIFVVALMAVFRGYFQGLGVMHFTAVSQIIEQLILIVVSISAAYIMFGIGTKYGNLMMNENYAASMGAAGATIGCGVGAVGGLLYLFFTYYRQKPQIDKRVNADGAKSKDTFIDVCFLILRTAAPMILCSAMYNITGIIDQSVYNHYMIKIGSGDMKSFYWGVYSGKYKMLINLPIALANAMSSAIIPSLTASISNKDYVSARSKMGSVIRVTMIISFPSAIGLSILAKPIISLLFKGEIDLAVIMLSYGTISVVFFSLSTLGNAILQGLNKIFTPLFNSLVALIVHVGFLYLFLVVFNCGIHSVIISNIVFAAVVCILDYFAISKTINYKPEYFQTFIIPFISSLIMGLLTFGVYKLLELLINYKIALFVSIFIAVIIYFTSLILLKGLNEYDMALIPYGNKIMKLLYKIGLYKENE